MNFKVPVVGTNVVHQTEDGSPAVNGATPPPVQAPAQTQPPERASLHQVRMPRPAQQQVEVRGEFDDKGHLKWFPVEQAQAQEPAQTDDVAGVGDSTVDAGGGALDGVADAPPQDTQVPPPTAQTFDTLQQQIQNLTQTVNILAQAQLRGMQPEPAKPQAPQPPDPTQFDFYEPAQVAEFHRLNNAYIQATVRHEVNAALEPHGVALQDAQLNAQYNAVVFQHGQDANFKPTMEAALRLVASFPNISIPDAYRHVASQQAPSPQKAAATTSQPVAKPAQRTITAQEAAQKAEQAKRLPASNGVSGTAEPALPLTLRNNVGALGRIMFHNQQSGRARPIGN